MDRRRVYYDRPNTGIVPDRRGDLPIFANEIAYVVCHQPSGHHMLYEKQFEQAGNNQ